MADITTSTIQINDGASTVNGNLTVTGDLTVGGTNFIVNTTTVEVEDNILQLNTTQADPDTATATTSGISVYRGDGVAQASLIFDDADDTWDLTNNLVIGGSISAAAGNLSGQLTVNSGSYNPLKLDRTAANNVNMSFYHQGTLKGYLGVGSTGNLSWGLNADSAQNDTIIHAGNIANQSVANASTIDGLAPTAFYRQIYANTYASSPTSRWYVVTLPYASSSGWSDYFYFDVLAYRDLSNLQSQLHYRVYLHNRGVGTNNNILTANVTTELGQPGEFAEFGYKSGVASSSQFFIKLGEDYSGISIVAYPGENTLSASMIAAQDTAPAGFTAVTPAPFIKSGGTSSQFLKADGSFDSSVYLTTVPVPLNGSWWNEGYVRVGTDGVMEMGKYMDFHTSDSGGSADYDLRVTVSPTTFAVGGIVSATGGNSTNWNAAYNYSTVGHLPLAGGTLTGNLNVVESNVGIVTEYGLASIEGTDAHLDLISSAAGSWGSAINFVEGTDSTTNANVWSIARQTTGADGSLNFNYGTLNNHNVANIKVKFSNTGVITATGGNSTEWNAGYDYSTVGHLPLSGGAVNGNVSVTGTNGAVAFVVNSTHTPSVNANRYGAQINFDISDSGTALTADRVYAALDINATSSVSGGDLSNEARIYGANVNVIATSDEDLVLGILGVGGRQGGAGTTANTSVMGVEGVAYTNAGLDNAERVTELIGLYGYSYASNSDGTNSNVGSAYGVLGKYLNTSGGLGAIVDAAYGGYFEVENDIGTITNAYGVRSVIDRDGGTTQNGYLFYGDFQGTIAGNKYGLWIAGESDNYISGDVGIGNSSPSAKLDVSGDTITRGTIYATNPMGVAGNFSASQISLNTTDSIDTTGWQGISFDTSTTANYGWSIGANRSSSGRGSFRFYEHNNSATGTERLTLLQDGNVGVGVPSPGVKLDVAGQIRGTSLIVDGTNDGNFGFPSFSWGGNTIYPTLYSSHVDRWIMHVNPHIVYVQNGVNGYTGNASAPGARIRLASDTAATSYWDIGVGVNTVGADKFSLGRENSPLITVDNTGRFGVGVTSLTRKLEVAGDAYIAGEFLATTNGLVRLNQYDNGLSGAGEIALWANGGTGWAAGDGLGKIRFYLNDSSGIGTRDVAKIEAVSEDGNGTTTTTPSGALVFYTSAYNANVAERVRINGTGNVEIKNNLSFGTEIANNGTSTLTIRNYDTTLVNANDIQGRILFSGRYWSDSNNQLVQSSIQHGHALSNGNGGSFLSFSTQTGGDGLVEQMRIDRIGNVGIGTTSPASRLSIDALGTPNPIEIFDDTTSGQPGIIITNRATSGGTQTAVTYAKQYGPSVGGSIFGSTIASKAFFGTEGTASEGLLIGTLQAKPLILGTNNTNRITILEGGNVSIGATTSASSAKLTVMGNQSFGLPGNGSNTSGRFVSIEGNTDASGEGSGRIFFTEHNSTTASMDNYGMSIGYRGGATTVTGVSGNNWTGLSQIGNGQWGMWGHDNDATGSVIMYGDRAATFVNLANNDLNNVGNGYYNGKLGIGTTAPQAPLHVIAASTDNDALIQEWSYSDADKDKYSLMLKQTVTTSVVRYNFSMVNNNTAYGDVLVLDRGSVGIGTSSPSQKLHVNGNILAGSWISTSTSNTRGKYSVWGGDLAYAIGMGNSYSYGYLGGTSTGSEYAMTFQMNTTSNRGFWWGNNGHTNAQGAMSLTNDGKLMVATLASIGYGQSVTTPSVTYALDVDGTIRATGDVIAYSDVRVKENVKTIGNALDKVMSLRGVEYNKIGETEQKIGVIAQEIEKVLPQVVQEDENGLKSVAYGNIVGVLIEAIKEQQKQIDELKAIINGGTR